MAITSFEYPQYWDNNLQPARKFVAANMQYAWSPTYSAIPVTMACWFNAFSFANQQLICFSNGSSTTDRCALRILSTGYVNSITQGGGLNSQASTSVAHTLGTWHHATAIASHVSPYNISYLDGRYLGTATTYNITPTLNNTSIGVFKTSSPTEYFNGLIALPCIWKAALNPSEIKALSQGAMPWTIRPQSIVSCPDMQTLYDPFLDARWTNSGSTLTQSKTIYKPKGGIALPTRTPAAILGWK